jgi:hypothetical protein
MSGRSKRIANVLVGSEICAGIIFILVIIIPKCRNIVALGLHSGTGGGSSRSDGYMVPVLLLCYGDSRNREKIVMNIVIVVGGWLVL